MASTWPSSTTRKIYPLYKIPQEEVELARKLIYRDTVERRSAAELHGALRRDEGQKAEADSAHVETLSVEDKLKYSIINGEKSIGEGAHKKSLEQICWKTRSRNYTPLDLINTVLLDGMRTVGELFGARKMQLPSVLDSAAVMKAAVAYLEPKMEKDAGSQKGTIVLATVKGDVHDIGKNLVDIILSNNGYKVVNLGIKQPADTIIKAAQEHKADAIGLSGLLVKSTLEMKYVIQDLERQRLEFPVICGGAALTRKYVEDDLRREYCERGVLCRRRVRRAARHGRSDRRRRRSGGASGGRTHGKGVREGRGRATKKPGRFRRAQPGGRRRARIFRRRRSGACG